MNMRALIVSFCCTTALHLSISSVTVAASHHETGGFIVALSEAFLGTPYAENTLIGGPGQPEKLVTDLSRLDCFTFLDAVEAMRRSAHDAEFATQLRQVRYRDGLVSYRHRRHFFSDWVADRDTMVIDASRVIGQGRTARRIKHLNLRKDGSLWLPGIDIVERAIDYIPTGQIDEQVLAALQSGDYLGVYSDADGLDVSHTGIVVKKNGHVRLRHASSRADIKRVVDEDLLSYLAGKPGIVVYRVR